MSKYSPVFRKYLNEYSKREVSLALFDIISVAPINVEKGTTVGTLVIEEGITHDKVLFQLNLWASIKEDEKIEMAKRAIQFKRRIENGFIDTEIDKNKPIKMYDI